MSSHYDADEEAKRLLISGASGGVLGGLSGLQLATSHPMLHKYAKKATMMGGLGGAGLGVGGLALGDAIMGKGDDNEMSDIGHGALGGGILGTAAGFLGAGKVKGGGNLAKYMTRTKALGGGGKLANMLKLLGIGTAAGGLVGAGHAASSASANEWRRNGL